MSAEASEGTLLEELDRLERSMRELLALVESPRSSDGSLARALAKCMALTPAAEELSFRCRAARDSERDAVTAALRRLVDLNAVMRGAVACSKASAAAVIEEARAVRANLHVLGAEETRGSVLDCVS